MTNRLLLDTHILLWIDIGDRRLTAATRKLVDDCWQGGGTIYFSAVSAWEIALLAEAGRIRLDLPVADWFVRFLDDPGMAVMPLTHNAALGAYQLHDLAHRDPADRLLIATAIELECPFVTYDGAITRFAEQHGRQYGFTVMA